MDFSDIATRAQSILNALVLALPRVVLGVVVLAVFVLVAWGGARLVRVVLRRSGQAKGVQLVFGRLIHWIAVGIGIAVALTIVFPSLDASSLFGALGFTSVAIGFAFKDIFQNLLAGLLILLTRPFRIGDQIVSGDHEGTVEDILVRATLLRTYDNRRVVIPNSELYTNRVVVNTAFEQRRLAAILGIGNDEDLGAAKERILRVLAGLDGVLDDPAPKVLVTAIADFDVTVEVRFWIAPTERREVVEVMDTVLEALKTDLDASGIDMPYPTQVVLLRNEGDQAPR